METEGHIIKLEKCDEDCFISQIVITRKKDTSIKLALDSKLLNDQIFKNKYQMPNIHKLIDNAALQYSEKFIFRLDKPICKIRPNLSTLSSPLRPLLNKKSVYKWDINHSIAFEKLKAEIVNITENSHFDIKEKTRLKTDASHNGLGATLEQLLGDQWKTIAFASRFLNNHEMKYSTIKLELLGVVWATEHFRNYLYGTEFQIVTDHKALLSALSANHGNKTMHNRLTRWVNRLLPFNFKISHLPGKDMGFTDLLSRLPSGKALPISHYDDEFVVASID